MNIELVYSGLLLQISNENIWIGLIGLASTFLGIFASRVQITPEVQKNKLETEKLGQEQINFLFEKFKEDNLFLREELKQIKVELKLIEEEYETKEKELLEQVAQTKEDLDFANKLIETLEEEITELKHNIEEKEETIKKLKANQN